MNNLDKLSEALLYIIVGLILMALLIFVAPASADLIINKRTISLIQKILVIQDRIKQRETLAANIITPKMTRKDVKSLLGEPDGKVKAIFMETYYYGHTEIIFDSAGLVLSIVK